MRRICPILKVLLLCMLVTSVSCTRKGRVIPADTLSEIYADMFMADQWIKQYYSARTKADTTFLYEPIFRKYGYDTRDYTASVHFYLEKPDKYSKILKHSAIILDKYSKRLQAVEDEINAREEFSAYVRREFVLDSLVHSMDSVFRVRDSLVTDSLQLDSLQLDSLRLDSLQLDSLAFDSLAVDSLSADSLIVDSLLYGQRDTSTLLRGDGPHHPSPGRHPIKRFVLDAEGKQVEN